MRALVLALSLLLAACGGSTPTAIDGTSKDAAERSIAAIAASLDDARRAEFSASIAMGWSLSEIAGKTADEMIALARTRKIAELKQTTIPALQARIAAAEKAVEEAQAQAKSSRRFLQGLALVKPEFVWRAMEDGSSAPLLTFNLRNDTSEAIQTIVFHAAIGPKSGQTAWIDQRFEFRFAEAVTSGEEKFVFVKPDLTLAGNARAADSRGVPVGDLSFRIDFIRVADLNGRTIMDDEGVTKAEADLQTARDALVAAERTLKRLEEGGSIAT